MPGTGPSPCGHWNATLAGPGALGFKNREAKV